MTQAETAVKKLVSDIVNRNGFDDLWRDLDGDTQEDIKGKWEAIVDTAIEESLKEHAADMTRAAAGIVLNDLKKEEARQKAKKQAEPVGVA